MTIWFDDMNISAFIQRARMLTYSHPFRGGERENVNHRYACNDALRQASGFASNFVKAATNKEATPDMQDEGVMSDGIAAPK